MLKISSFLTVYSNNAVVHYSSLRPTGFAAKTSSVTVADINLYVTYAAVEACGHVDLSGFRDLSAWAEKVRAAIPNHDKVVQEGTAAFAQAYKAQAK